MYIYIGSSKMVPFNRSHIGFYRSSCVIVSLSFIVFEIKRDIS